MTNSRQSCVAYCAGGAWAQDGFPAGRGSGSGSAPALLRGSRLVSPGGFLWRILRCMTRPEEFIARTDIVKVIASQIRKGNVVEVNDQLYAVLKAESFFPGKGTPTTQIDMRRLSDGVKTSQRYKTTEQVERAF